MHFGIRGSRAPIVRRYLLASPTMNSGMLDVLRIIFHGGTLCQGLISISISTSSANDPLQKVVKRHNSLRFSRYRKLANSFRSSSMFRKLENA